MEFVKVEIFIPKDYVVEMANELNERGILNQGNYDYTFSTSIVIGHWRPLEGANPFEGEIGVVSEEEETKMEFRIKKEDIEEVKNIINRIHPYEEPVVNFMSLI